MKEILLSKGKVSIVDDKDYEWLDEYKWFALNTKSGYYAATHGGRLLMHRMIMRAAKGEHVDHIDHNPLNNTRANLRICNPSENLANQKLSKMNTTGFKGVSRKANARKYTAGIMVNQKSIHLGYFENLIDAAFAYDKAALRYFGEFALTNAMMFGESGAR